MRRGIRIIGGVSLMLLAAEWVKVYGDYKYHCGRCDANELNRIIIDSQYTTIKQLIERLKKVEETKA